MGEVSTIGERIFQDDQEKLTFDQHNNDMDTFSFQSIPSAVRRAQCKGPCGGMSIPCQLDDQSQSSSLFFSLPLHS